MTRDRSGELLGVLERELHATWRSDRCRSSGGELFRSSRAEPFGEAFLRRAIARLFEGDVSGVRDAYVSTVAALRRREISTYDVSSRVRLTKTPERYLAVRGERRELTYEALLACGRTSWTVGERVRVYRTANGGGGLAAESEDGGPATTDPVLLTTDHTDHTDQKQSVNDPRDYDVDHYVRVLREQFAGRLARALTPEAFMAVIADPDQPSLFEASLADVTPVLTRLKA